MSLAQQSRPFIQHIDKWLTALPTGRLSQVAAKPGETAVLCVDIINGFCTVGPLASPRVQGIVKPITRLLKAAYKRGVRQFVLTQDTHPVDAVEFAAYPPHCVRGTAESTTAPELLKLPFASEFQVIEKNSISSSMNTGLDGWLDKHPQIKTFIVVGDCTDLCTYQLAMHLRLRANAGQQSGVRVVLPADCVQTYDTPVPLAKRLSIPAHEGDLLHAVFLYNMWSNGIEVMAGLR